MMKQTKSTLIALLIFLSIHSAFAEEDESVPVGMTGTFEQLVIPGSELEVKSIGDKSMLVVRIVETYPHGSDFRYDIEYYGLKPGNYNLVDFLQRIDQSDLEVPEVPVAIRSILPLDQIEPNSIRVQKVGSFGSYQFWVTVGCVLWALVLLYILFGNRRKKLVEQELDSVQKQSLADRIRPLVNDAIEKKASQGQLANLEMMLVSLWRKRLNMDEMPANKALIELRKNDQAAPLLLQLERWLHSPHHDEEIDVEEILKPYKEMPEDFVPEQELQTTQP